MTSPLDDAATALVAAEEHVAALTAERGALLARVNELDYEVARLMWDRDTRIAELEAERERMREALERALPYVELFAEDRGGFIDGDEARELARKLRAALAPATRRRAGDNMTPSEP